MNTENEFVPDAQRPEELRRFLREVKKKWTDTQIDAILDAKGYCEYCGADIVSSVESFGSSPWDHVVPKCKGGEHKDSGQSDEEVFDRNIALACWTCNNIKGKELPDDVSAEKLKKLPREKRVEECREWVLRRRQERQVIREFAAFRELVEIKRCAGHGS